MFSSPNVLYDRFRKSTFWKNTSSGNDILFTLAMNRYCVAPLCSAEIKKQDDINLLQAVNSGDRCCIMILAFLVLYISLFRSSFVQFYFDFYVCMCACVGLCDAAYGPINI